MDKRISNKRYEQILKVWNAFKMKTMIDCQGLYLKSEVLFLDNVFE